MLREINKANKAFHSAAGSGNEGMYHSGVKEKRGIRKEPSVNKSVNRNALIPRAGTAQEFVNKKKDKEFIKKADKNLKGFNFGMGVGK